jgi:hypothetical protein
MEKHEVEENPLSIRNVADAVEGLLLLGPEAKRKARLTHNGEAITQAKKKQKLERGRLGEKFDLFDAKTGKRKVSLEAALTLIDNAPRSNICCMFFILFINFMEEGIIVEVDRKTGNLRDDGRRVTPPESMTLDKPSNNREDDGGPRWAFGGIEGFKVLDTEKFITGICNMFDIARNIEENGTANFGISQADWKLIRENLSCQRPSYFGLRPLQDYDTPMGNAKKNIWHDCFRGTRALVWGPAKYGSKSGKSPSD